VVTPAKAARHVDRERGRLLSPRHLDLLFDHPELADLDAAARRVAIEEVIDAAGVADAPAVAAELTDFVDGFGPLTSLMHDDSVTDVLVNAPNEVWVERDGKLQMTDVRFVDASELRALVDLLIGKAGGRADTSRPIADARLADGSRFHVVLPPVAAAGPVVSIRRFPRRPLDLDDLVRLGMIEVADHDALLELVRERCNLVIAGATGTGKTTLLNALLRAVAGDQRIVTVEETPELRVDGSHVVSLVARAPNTEGAGAVDLEDLVRASLRMRPDRIVVGEVRGAEALVALSALSTGHEGSMVTVHARSAADVLGRLVSLALTATGAPGADVLHAQVRAAFDATVFLTRRRGSRVIASLDLS
jgi:pilus assembly protein CpaF